jgi:site-specific recombinase XerD
MVTLEKLIKQNPLKGKQNLNSKLRDYLNHLEEKRLSKQSISKYKSAIVKFLEFTGYDLTESDGKIQEFNNNNIIKNFLKFLGLIESKQRSESELVEAFKNGDLYALNISQSTLDGYANIILGLLKKVKDKPEKITKRVITEWLKGNKANTKKSKLAALDKFLAFYGLKLDFDLNRLKPSKRTMENIQIQNIQNCYLTKDEEKKLTKWLASINDEITDIDDYMNIKDKCIVLLGLECGLRIMSVPEIKVSSFDFERSELIVTEKGCKVRNIYLNTKVKRFFRTYIKKMKLNRDDYLVNNNNRKYTKNGINNRISGLFKELGLKTEDRQLSFHNLRHTYACNLYNSGVPLEMIQKEIGHERLETTQIYAKANDITRKKYLNRSRVKY